jgi:hypothetical protein
MATETGIQLKKDLGLENLPKVFYARCIGLLAYKVYFVFFDSRRPLINITSYEAHKKEFAPVIPFKGGGRRLSLTNILRIEDFAGTIENSVFIRIDLSGRFQQMGDFEESIAVKKKTINHELEAMAKAHLLGVMCEDMRVDLSADPSEFFPSQIVEAMVVDDFKTDDAVSAMTQKFRKLRKQLVGRENIAVKLVGFQFDRKKDWAQFMFRSASTPNTPVKQDANPLANFKLQPNPNKVYTLLLRFNNFFEWMLDTLPDGQALTMKDMKDAIRVCPVKFWSNSPAFHWQGANYQLSQLDAAIYPTNIAPKFWNQPQYHGDNNLLDKYLMALLRYLSFFLNNMTAMANKNLQKAGIIGKVKYNYQQ